MKKRHSPLRTISLLLSLVAALVVGVGAWRTYAVTGEAALAAMDAEERQWLERLGRLDRGMRRAEVEAALGPASRWTGLGASEIGHWDMIPGEPLADIRVYFDLNGAAEVRWMRIGRFTYRFTLPPRSRGG